MNFVKVKFKFVVFPFELKLSLLFFLQVLMISHEKVHLFSILNTNECVSHLLKMVYFFHRL